MDEIRQSGLFDGEALLKRNKIVLFALNGVLVLPCAIRHFSPAGAGVTLLLLLLAFFLTVVRSDAGLPAVRGLPVLGVFDVLILLALSYKELLFFLPESSEFISARLYFTDYDWLLALGVLLCLLPFREKLALWSKGLGWVVIGGYLTLRLWCSDFLPSGQIEPGLKASILFLLLCVLAWFSVCAVSRTVDENTLSRDRWLSRLLLTIYLVLGLAEPALLQQFFSRMYQWFLTASEVGFAWWKALLAAGVLTGCAVASYDLRNKRMGPDSLVLAGLSGFVLLVRVLMSRYFICGWIIPLVFLAGSLLCLKNEGKQAKTLQLSSPAYLAAQTAVLLAAVLLLKRGVWITVLCMAVYALVFTALAGKMVTSRRQLWLWLIRLSCPAVLAAGTVWHLRFLPASLWLIAAAFAVLALVVILLHWPNPTGMVCPDGLKWMVFGAMVLLCLLVSLRFGSKVEVAFQPDSETAHIELEARGRDNKIVSAKCSWSRFTGEALSGEQTLQSGGMDIPIQGEKLTIVVTDAFGTTTTVTDWYLRWLWQ